MSRKKEVAFAVLPVLLVAVLVAIVLFPRAGRLPWEDYWGFMPRALPADGAAADPLRWLSLRSNEHLITLPGLVFALDVVLAHGGNRGEVAVAVALLATVGLILLGIVARTHGGRPVPLPIMAAFLALMLYTPAAAANLFMGAAGVQWYLADVFAAFALAAIPWGVAAPSLSRGAAVVAVGFLAVLCHSTSLALWPALAVAAALSGAGRRFLVALVAGGSAAAAFFVLTYQRPAQIPPMAFTDLPGAARFVAVFLGAPLCEAPVLAGVAGLAGLGVTAWLVAVVASRREHRRRLAPWAGLLTYALANAIIASVARGGLGGARSSRYAVLAVLFWIALALLTLALLPGDGVPVRVAAIGGVAVLVVATWVRGAPVFAGFCHRAARQPLAELALVFGIDDPEALSVISQVPAEPLGARGWAAARAHVPFDRPRPGLGEVIGDRVPVCPDLYLDLSRVVALPVAGALRLEGLLRGAVPPGGEVLLVDAGGALRGEVAACPARCLFAAASPSPWAGYALPAAGDDVLNALARTSGGGLCRLPGVLELRR